MRVAVVEVMPDTDSESTATGAVVVDDVLLETPFDPVSAFVAVHLEVVGRARRQTRDLGSARGLIARSSAEVRGDAQAS